MLLTIRVQPGAKHASVRRMADGVWRVSVKAPAVHGKANEAVCRYIAQVLGVSHSAVTLHTGDTSRTKTLLIASTTAADVEAAMVAIAGS